MRQERETMTRRTKVKIMSHGSCSIYSYSMTLGFIFKVPKLAITASLYLGKWSISVQDFQTCPEDERVQILSQFWATWVAQISSRDTMSGHAIKVTPSHLAAVTCDCRVLLFVILKRFSVGDNFVMYTLVDFLWVRLSREAWWEDSIVHQRTVHIWLVYGRP